LSVDLIKEPRRGVSPQDADRSKYCQYHHCHGHITGECAALKDKIEELIQAGHLQRYVARQRQYGRRQERNPRGRSHREKSESPRAWEERRRNSSQSREKSPPRRADTGKTVVNAISGGFGRGGSSSSARKRHLRAIQSVHMIS